MTLFGGGEPVKCTVSRHNTFSLSCFVFITRPLFPPPPNTLRLAACLGASVCSILYHYPSDLRTQLSMLLAIWSLTEAEKAHTATASPHFLTHTHAKTVLQVPETTGCLRAIQYRTLLKPKVGGRDVLQWLLIIFSFAYSGAKLINKRALRLQAWYRSLVLC